MFPVKNLVIEKRVNNFHHSNFHISAEHLGQGEVSPVAMNVVVISILPIFTEFHILDVRIVYALMM